MTPRRSSRLRRLLPLLAISLLPGLLSPRPVRASDFADSPSIAQDQGADLGDAFFFLDPNDNTRAVLALTVHGFLAPGAPLNAAAFDPKVKFLFEVENTGDAVADQKLNVRFDAPSAPGAPQTAHVKGLGVNFTAPTTPVTLAPTANSPTVTTDDATGFRFFAGPVDDPFFCDLAGVNRYFASVRNGAPDPAALRRGRDTFAGYNVLAIALSVPVSYLRGTSDSLGLDAVTKRRPQTPAKTGGYLAEGSYVTVDRVGNPGINLLFVPPARQDEYNAAKATDDAAGKFSADIKASLQSLGTSDLYVSILNGLVSRGDYLRLNLTIQNKGAGGGSNPEAGFPNGRRLGDDVVDTLLGFVTNGSLTSDGVNAGDSAPRDGFPFFAPPHQP